MQVQPYVFFGGRCDEALEFYKKALGAETTMLMRFKQCPDPAMCAPETAEKVMHASFKVGETTILASDGRCEGKMAFEGFSLSIAADTAADADRLFAALSDGGQVRMPMSQTFFSERFGMVADKFGVLWMIIVGK